jgi:hypothetical protein
MVLNVSAKFAKRLNSPVSFPDRRPLHLGWLDSWTTDIFQSQEGQCALVMNDTTLSMVVLPLKGVRSFDQFLGVFLRRAARIFEEAGGVLDTQTQTIIVLRRSDRSVIGTMNEAREHARLEIEHLNEHSDWNKVEDRLNGLLFSRNEYHPPREALSRALKSPLY